MSDSERKDGQLTHAPETHDGQRVNVHSGYVCPWCHKQQRLYSYSDPQPEPHIVLCGKAYCRDCYSKAVALLEADMKAEEIRLESLRFGHHARQEAARAARERMME